LPGAAGPGRGGKISLSWSDAGREAGGAGSCVTLASPAPLVQAVRDLAVFGLAET
jgi:hypothetical protein